MAKTRKEPANVAKALKGTEELVAKGVSASTLASETYGSGLITPQNLSPLLVNVAARKFPFYQMVQKPKGAGQSAKFNLVDALFETGEDASPDELFYEDGGVPEEKTTSYSNVINPFKDLGLKGSVTGRSMRQAKGGTPNDLVAEEVKNTMQRVAQAIDWLSFWSRSDVTNSNGIAGFKGLDELISTNVIDAGGAPISKALLDEASRKISYQGGGGELSHIFSSPGVAQDIDNLYNDQNRIVINQGGDQKDLTFGNYVRRLNLSAGQPEVVADYFLNPGDPYPQGQPYSASSGPSGISLSTVFLLPMSYVFYEELLPMSKIDLATVADKVDFMVLNSGTIKLQAEPWAAKIINVAENTFSA